MKGTLYKEKDGEWYVMNFQATFNGPLLQTLPVLKESFDVNDKMKPITELIEGKEVEFELYIGKYAKLIRNLQ